MSLKVGQTPDNYTITLEALDVQWQALVDLLADMSCILRLAWKHRGPCTSAARAHARSQVLLALLRSP